MREQTSVAGSGHDLSSLVEAFRAHAHEICGEAMDPELAQDMCEYWSASFVDWLAEQGVDADLIVCEGSLVDFPNHSWDHVVDFSSYWHVVARVGSIDVDWSRRQFDVTATVPHLCHAFETAAQWRIVMERSEYDRMEDRLELEYEAQAA